MRTHFSISDFTMLYAISLVSASLALAYLRTQPTYDLLLCPAFAWVEAVRRCRECTDAYHAHAVLRHCDVVQNHSVEVICCEYRSVQILYM